MKNTQNNSLDEDKIILSLYNEGITKVPNLFDNELLTKILKAKEDIFFEFPYGQNNNYEKNQYEDIKRGEYPIKNPLELDKIFRRILENKTINNIAEFVLGKNYYFTNMSMRIITKTDYILYTHRDHCGGISFSLLLDDITINQGETFFYRNSYNNPPPAFVDLNKFSSSIVQTVGVKGDVYFWFPDSWHGRNHNFSNKKTCILMCDIQNESTEKKIISIYSNNGEKNKTFLNKIFKSIGNQPDNIFKHFLYTLLRFKIFKKKINDEKIIYSRLILNKNYGDNFSLLNYFKTISLKKFFKVLIFNILQSVLSQNSILKLRKLVFNEKKK